MAAESGELLLEVRDLRTHLDTKNGLVRTVDGVSFRLHAGETLGIIGESGSGKSMTALSILQVVPKPAARIVGGEVLYRGQDLLDKSEGQMRRIRGREIAVILQDPQTSLNPVFTVGNQIMEALRIHRRNDGRKALVPRAIDALKQVRIAAPEERRGFAPRCRLPPVPRVAQLDSGTSSGEVTSGTSIGCAKPGGRIQDRPGPNAPSAPHARTKTKVELTRSRSLQWACASRASRTGSLWQPGTARTDRLMRSQSNPSRYAQDAWRSGLPGSNGVGSSARPMSRRNAARQSRRRR